MGKKNWSINVTTRNPARLKDILKVLSRFEGKVFNRKIQADFIDAVVGAGLYKPIIGIKDKPLRGRTWAGIFNTLGFAIAYETYGKVIITWAGKALLSSREGEQSEIFLKQLLKWQLPNPTPTARGFQDFNIIPFIATLYLLKRTGGLSKIEFGLFVPTLCRIEELAHTVRKVHEFRRSLKCKKGLKRRAEFLQEYLKNFVLDTYSEELKCELRGKGGIECKKLTEEFAMKKKNNLKDYGDTIIRYFRYTGFISIKGRKITLSDLRAKEIQKLLEVFDGGAKKFRGKNKKDILENFYSYLGSDTEPSLPYEASEILLKMILELKKDLWLTIKKAKKIDKNFKFATEIPATQILFKFPSDRLKQLLNKLRENKREVLSFIQSSKIRTAEELEKIIRVLKSIESGDPSIPDRSLWLEWYTYLAFKAIDDEELIKPNFPLDENNEPMSVAVANKPDIEAYYSNFVLVPEVTMSARRDQWVQEGMPVPRHVLQIKQREERKIFGIFIAPTIHYDTRNQFFIVSVHGIEGGKVTIIPLTLKQFIEVLEVLVKIRKKRVINKEDFIMLFERLDVLKEESNNGGEWLIKIQKEIECWKENLLAIKK